MLIYPGEINLMYILKCDSRLKIDFIYKYVSILIIRILYINKLFFIY